MDLETYIAQFAPDSAPGWTAIDKHLIARLGRDEPDFHYGTTHPFALGGRDPLEGISVYIRHNPAHFLFVSYGLSNLYYDPEAVGREFSGWGFELTFRLALDPSALPGGDADVPKWPINLMQNLARYVFDSQKWFEHGHFINANGPIRAGSATDKTAIVFCNDPELNGTDTPHGHLDYLQIVGITAAELDALQSGARSAEALIEEKAQSQPLLITSLAKE